MAIGTATAIIGAGVLGAGASLYGASKSAGAAKDAANAQAKANSDAIQLQREGRENAERVLTPYVSRGNEAFSLMAPHLGMGGSTTPTGQSSQIMYPQTALGGTQGTSRWSGYLQANPDVLKHYQTLSPQQRAQYPTPEAFAQYHYNTVGRTEGRSMGEPSPQSTGQVGSGQKATTGLEEYQTPEQAQEAAWEKYRNETTYGKIGDYEAEKARGEFMDLAGSSGSALSGRTLRGMAEVGEEAAMRNFGSYMGVLGGVSDQGYNASTGIASAGQTFANNASSLTQATGNAQAAAAQAKGDAWQTGLADVAGWAGWAAGGLNNSGSGSSGSGGSGSLHTAPTNKGWINF